MRSPVNPLLPPAVGAVVLAGAVAVVAALRGPQTPLWVSAVFGVILAIVLWVMAWAGEVARGSVRTATVPPRTYAVTVAITVVLGAAIAAFTSGLMAWPIAAIIGGAVAPAGRLAARPNGGQDG